MSYFVTAISTDSGKSVVSALLASTLQFNYWKPVQAGFPTDTSFIESFDPKIKIKPEQYVLQTACSPHEAAVIDGVNITTNEFSSPGDNYIVEGAGGVAVPINYEGDTMLDLMTEINLPVVIVSNTYLGSINHTLLTIEALQNRNIPIHGIVFNGDENKATEKIILDKTGVPFLFRLDKEESVDIILVDKYSAVIKEKF